MAASQKKSMSLDQILKCADWSSVRTFSTFYDLQVPEAEDSTSTADTTELDAKTRMVIRRLGNFTLTPLTEAENKEIYSGDENRLEMFRYRDLTQLYTSDNS